MVVVLTIAGGWWYINQSNVPDVAELSKSQNSTVQTPSAAQQKPIKITAPTSRSKYSYEGFDLRWEIAPSVKAQIKDIKIYGSSEHVFCYNTQYNLSKDPNNDPNCGKELLLATISAETGIYHVDINPGCLLEMPVYVRLESDSGSFSDSVGPIILEGGACGSPGD